MSVTKAVEAAARAAWHARENCIPERVRIKFEDRFVEDDALTTVMTRAALAAFLDAVKDSPTEEMREAVYHALRKRGNDADGGDARVACEAVCLALRRGVAGDGK